MTTALKGLIFSSIIFFAPLIGESAVIYGPISNAANGHLYYLLSKSTWTAAETEAVSLGGHLVTINDAVEDGWVYTNFSGFGGSNSHLWIGLTDQAQEGTFVWASGQPVTYTHWNAGEPNDASGNDDYVHINSPVYPSRTTWDDHADVAADSSVHPFRGVVEVGPYAASPVVAWGEPLYGVTNVPPGLTNVVAIAAGGYHSLALRSDGTVVAWGRNDEGQATVTPGLNGVMAIAAGGYHSLALKSDGTVVAWGDNSYGQLNVPVSLSNVVAIAAGYGHSLALRSDGTVVAWGWNFDGQTTLPLGLNQVVAIDGGDRHSLALRSDGSVVAWGANDFGQVNIPPGLSNVVAIAAGANHNLALKNDGSMVAWGANGFGQLNVPPGLANVTAIAAGSYHSLALRSDRTMVVWGWNNVGQTNVPPGLSNVMATAGGGFYSLALVNNGSTSPLPSCVALPAGLVSWWRGEGDAADAVGGNHGTLVGNVAFAAGKVGMGFSLNGTNSYVSVPHSASLNLSNEITIEFWYKSEGTGDYYVFAKHDTESGPINYNVDLTPGVRVSAYFNDPLVQDSDNGAAFELSYHPSAPPSGAFHHLAATFRQVTANSVEVKTFIDGQLVRTRTFSASLARALCNAPVTIGAAGNFSCCFFKGIIDEVSLYSRALSTSEIAAIYNADNAGKCTTPTPPVIATQPANQTVTVGGTATFVVAAGGTAPLSYRWRFNGTNIANATNTSFTIPSVQTNNAGSYSVVVSNALGSINSADAVLTVNPPPTCVFPPAGLVSWWRGEGDAADALGGNHGLVQGGLSFGTGKVGQSFNFNVAGSNVKIPASSTLDVGKSNGFTIEAWIKPADSGIGRPIMEFVPNGTSYGVHFYVNQPPAGSLYAGVTDTANNLHSIQSAGGLVVTSSFQHVALTYDKPSGIARLFVNGVVVKESSLGSFIPVTSADAYLGYRPSGVPGGPVDYTGLIDEPALYSRALSTNEIQAIYNAGSAGKCATPMPPFIATQPANQTVTVGGTATFVVAAGGTAPLSYQWQFNGTNITSGTNATLNLINVQMAQAGSYSVVVANALGSTNSANALLTVSPSVPASVVAWGYNFSGQTNVPAGLSNVVGIAGGWQHSLAFKADGTVVAWGDNGAGQGSVPGGLNNVVGIAAGETHNLALKGDGTVVAWGGNGYGQRNVPAGLSNVIAVAAGEQHSLALKSDGTVVAWGGNGYGQLNIPAGLSNVVAISTRLHHNLALRGNGTVVAWGYNADGETNIPGGLSNVVAVAAGGFHSLALKGDGTVVAWGYNNYGQINVPAGLSNVVAIGGSGFHSLASRSDGTVVAWGYNGNGQTIIPAGLANVTAISAGGYHSLAIVNGGSFLLPPTITFQPANQTVTVGSTDTFTVVASGTLPLSYQWRFNGTNITDATNSALALSNVQLNQAGSYSVVVSNAVGSILSSNAILTVTLPSATVRVVNTNGISGQLVTVPIELVANGNENALSFSLNFSTQSLTYASVVLGDGAAGATLLLNTSQTGDGKLGVAVALPTGNTFVPGNHEVIRVRFNTPILIGTNSVISPLTFGDQPVLRQLSDTQPQILPANYVGGTVTLSPSDLEGDVAPRPAGDRTLTLIDWVQAGRYAAGLDTPADGGEFQRADCAPRGTLGDGRIRVTDWVQAGRYAAGLDPVTIVGGPTTPSGVFTGLASSQASAMKAGGASAGGTREVRVADVSALQGLAVTIPVNLQAQGNEHAAGFSLVFDPTKFTYAGANLGSGAVGATFIVNTNQSAVGKVGMVLELPFGSNFTTGAREIARISLTPTPSAAGSNYISFGDEPVPREISDAAATNVLASGYIGGSVVVTTNPSPLLNITLSGQGVTLTWPGWAGDFDLQVSDTMSLSNIWTNVNTALQTNGGEIVFPSPILGEPKFFRLRRP